MQLGAFVAPHLRDALTVNRAAKVRVQPIDGIALVLVASTLAAAGPTWSRQASPWLAETAPLVVALEVSEGGDGVGSLAGHITLSSAQWQDFTRRCQICQGNLFVQQPVWYMAGVPLRGISLQ